MRRLIEALVVGPLRLFLALRFPHRVLGWVLIDGDPFVSPQSIAGNLGRWRADRADIRKLEVQVRQRSRGDGAQQDRHGQHAND